MNKKKPFRVLTPEQYERLTLDDKLAYIDEAIRVKKVGARMPRSARSQPKTSRTPAKATGRDPK